ncbi:MAG: RHS repeat-associated core domain-containing protein, partial [Planctomycetota bacterium]
RNANGVATREWVYGVGIDEPIRMTLKPHKPAATNYYFQQNAIGSVVAVADTSGNVVERYKYLAFGKEEIYDATGVKRSGSAVGNPIRFQGRWRDSAEGSPLVYFRARYYDPKDGRFTSRDPIGVWGDPGQFGNAYGAFGNNGVSFGDPFGLKETWGDWFAHKAAFATGLAEGAWTGVKTLADAASFHKIEALHQNVIADQSSFMTTGQMNALNKIADYTVLASYAAGGALVGGAVMTGEVTTVGLSGAMDVALTTNTIIVQGGGLTGAFVSTGVGGTLALMAGGPQNGPAVVDQMNNTILGASPLGGKFSMPPLLPGGSGPAPGVIELSPGKPSGAFANGMRNTNPVEFVFDLEAARMLVGKAPCGGGSRHENLAQVLGYLTETNAHMYGWGIPENGNLVGGMVWRGPNGEIMTNEHSGHYGGNWTPAAREAFMKFVQSTTGAAHTHEGWGTR